MYSVNKDKSLLNVSNYYNVSTKNQSYISKPLKVISILAYTELINRINFDLNTLAINEKVLNETDDDYTLQHYFINKTFYHCCGIDEEGDADSNDIIVLWNEIIDENSITNLNTMHEFKLNIDLPINFDDSKKNMIDAIKAFIVSEFSVDSDKVELFQFNNVSESKMSEYEILMTKAKELDKVFYNLNKLGLASDIVTKLSDIELIEKVNKTLKAIATINESISFIRSKIGTTSS